MGVKVTGQFEPAGDFSIVDGKDVSGNITGSNISSSGQIEAASIGTNLGSIISGSTPFDRSDVSGSWRGELSSSVYLQNVKTTISGSLGSNATLIRSLTAAGISGSFTSVSSSLASRITTAETELGNTLISSSAQIADDISGSFTSTSSSLASRITTEEGNVDTLQARNLIAGDGLTGGGTLAADRTFNIGAGTGITVNANDIAVSAAQTSITSIINNSLGKIGTNDDHPTAAYITFGTSNEINTFINNSERLSVRNGGIDVTGVITSTGNISGSATSTGSFGRLESDTFNTTTFNSTEVTSTNLTVTGTITGSSLDVSGDGTFGGNIRAVGDVIAQRYIVSSSVTHLTQSFSSGSTIFGDSSDDTHVFTGSLSINSGGINVEKSSDFLRTNTNWARNHITLSRPSGSDNIVVGQLATAVNGAYTAAKGYRYYLTNRANGTSYATQHLAILESGDIEIWNRNSQQNDNINGNARLYVVGSNDSAGTYGFRVANSSETDIFAVENDSNVTITGNLTTSGNISGSSTSTGSFGRIYSADSANIAGLEYPTADGDDGSVFMTNGSGVITLESNVKYVSVKNVETHTLSKGTPVHATGTTGNTPEVVAASASISTKMPATFVLAEQLTAGSEGRAVLSGFLNGIDTSGFTEGNNVYVGADGGYTESKPTGTNLIQNIAIVGKVDASNGSIFVYGSGRSNDVPNLLNDHIFFGSGSDQMQQLHISGAIDHATLNDITFVGNISGSSTSTGSFGHLHVAAQGSSYLATLGNDGLSVKGSSNSTGTNFRVRDGSGNTRFNVQGYGQTGIGTDSAQTMLHIKFVHSSLNNSIGEYIRLEDNSNYSASIGLGSNGTLKLMPQGGDVNIASEGSSAGNLTVDGKVHIGSSNTPTNELQVVGTIEASGNISGSSTSTGSFGSVHVPDKIGIGTTAPDALLDIKGDTSTWDGMAKIYFTDSNSNSNSRNFSIGNGGTGYGQLSFIVSATKDGEPDNAGTDIMVLDGVNQRVGINTVLPSYGVHIDNQQLVVDYTGIGFGHRDNSNNQFRIFTNISSGHGELYVRESNDNNRVILKGNAASQFHYGVSGSAVSTGSFGAGYIDNKLGIGTSSPLAKLNVDISSNAVGILVNATDSNDSIMQFTNSTTGTGTSDGFEVGLEYSENATLRLWETGKSILFKTGGDNTRMVIDDSGRVGIGTTSPGDYNSVGDNLVVANTSGNAGITIASSTTGYGVLYFADATSGAGEYDGAVEYNQNTQQMKFWAGRNVSPPNIMLESNGDVTLGADISGSASSTGSFGRVVSADGVFEGAGSKKLIIDSNSNISLSNNDLGSSNTLFGYQAGNFLIAGSNQNTVIGHQALVYAGSADTDGNTAVGFKAMFGSSAGSVSDKNPRWNTAIGYQSLQGITTGDNNVALGYQSGIAVSTGPRNTIIGNGAGGTITAGENNILIGSGADVDAAAGSNRIGIGYNVSVDVDHKTVIGASTQTVVEFGGDALISGSAKSTGSFGVTQTEGIRVLGGTYSNTVLIPDTLRFGNDTDTEFRRRTSNNVEFRMAGTDMVRIDTTGLQVENGSLEVESGNVIASGNISGSSTSTGSFGTMRAETLSLGTPLSYAFNDDRRLFLESGDIFLGDSSPKILFSDTAGGNSGEIKREDHTLKLTAYSSGVKSSEIHLQARAAGDGASRGGILFRTATHQHSSGPKDAVYINLSGSVELMRDGANLSGSATSTGSFGRVEATTVSASKYIGQIGSRYVHSQTSDSATWTINHNIGSQYPVVTVYNTDDQMILPEQGTATDSDTFTLTFSEAIQGKAVVSVGGIGTNAGGNYIHVQSDSSTNWNVTHSLSQQYPNITVFDENDEVILPETITALDDNHSTITFSSGKTGYANFSIGSGIPNITHANAGKVLKVRSDGTGVEWSPTSNDVSGSMSVSGSILPTIDNFHDLGSDTQRWANLYTGDIQLSNEGSGGNEVDGTTGSWTIQEGEDDLYLLNRKNGKKYKFKLEEIT